MAVAYLYQVGSQRKINLLGYQAQIWMNKYIGLYVPEMRGRRATVAPSSLPPSALASYLPVLT